MEKAGVMPTAYTYTLLLHCLALRRRMVDGCLVGEVIILQNEISENDVSS